jgi:hypothetical protein
MRDAVIDLLRPHAVVTSKVFQILFVQLVNNLALLLASCCNSFVLYVVANRTCIFLVSLPFILLSTPPKFLHFFCG